MSYRGNRTAEALWVGTYSYQRAGLSTILVRRGPLTNNPGQAYAVLLQAEA